MITEKTMYCAYIVDVIGIGYAVLDIVKNTIRSIVYQLIIVVIVYKLLIS